MRILFSDDSKIKTKKKRYKIIDTNNLEERVHQLEQLKFLPLDFTAA